MNRILSVLAVFTLSALLFSSCGIISFPQKQDADYGLGVLTEEKITPSNPEDLLGGWYSEDARSVLFFTDSAHLSSYQIHHTGYCYDSLATATYTYDGITLEVFAEGSATSAWSATVQVDQTLTMTLSGETYLYERVSDAPDAYVEPVFPDMKTIASSISISLPTMTGLTLSNTYRENARYAVIEEYWGDQSAKPDLLTGTVKVGDAIDINYEGLLNGVAFDGGTSSGQFAIAADDTGFIEGFCSQIVGHSTEEGIFAIEVTFPENYSASLAGKDVVFNIQVNGIYPAITDEDMAGWSDGTYLSVEAAEAACFTSLIAQNLWELLPAIPLTAISLPAEAYNFFYEHNLNRISVYADNYGIDIDTYLSFCGTTRKLLEADCREIGLTYLRPFVVANALGLTLDDSTREAIETELMDGYVAGGNDLDSVKAYFDENPAELEAYVMKQFVEDYLIENNTF